MNPFSMISVTCQPQWRKAKAPQADMLHIYISSTPLKLGACFVTSCEYLQEDRTTVDKEELSIKACVQSGSSQADDLTCN